LNYNTMSVYAQRIPVVDVLWAQLEWLKHEYEQYLSKE
jgi:hypothetical protein